MRGSIAFLAILGALTVARAGEGDEERARERQDCLSQIEVREAVAQKTVVAPLVAIRAARTQASAARILRASLCRNGDRLAYHITALHKDGRVSRVTVDGRSGKVEPDR